MINLILKLSGLNWLWIQIDGYKSYIAGTSKMLLGLSAMCGGLVSLLSMLSNAKSPGEAWALFHRPEIKPILLVLSGGYYSFHDGLADIGQRHALTKGQKGAQAGQGGVLAVPGVLATGQNAPGAV